jgi:hypothetical protein
LRIVVAVAAVALWQPPLAGAQPALPPAPPYVPGDVSPQPGSFSYPYNVIVVPPPASVDARGVNVTANVDPGSQSAGLPGSRLGNSAPPANSLTGSNVLYGIEAGIGTYQQPNPTVTIAAGSNATGLEDPSGQPPQDPGRPEAAAPTTAAGDAPPVLEDPRANRSTD